MVGLNKSFDSRHALNRVFAGKVVFYEFVELIGGNFLEETKMSRIDAYKRYGWEIKGVDSLKKRAISADTDYEFHFVVQGIGKRDFCGIKLVAERLFRGFGRGRVIGMY